jgi:hypothetical protein
VNVWGWVSSRGTGLCVIVEERLTALVYRDILEQALLRVLSVLPVFGNNFVFQQDNCPIHTAHLIRDFLQANDNEVTTLDWPARSPDCNPIENIWGIMAKEVNNKILPQNHQELIQSISDTYGGKYLWTVYNAQFCQCRGDSKWS